MSGIQDTLKQLQRRIAEARLESADSSRDAHIAELTQRFAEVEAQMFSEHSLRREALAIHQRTQRRRQELAQRERGQAKPFLYAEESEAPPSAALRSRALVDISGDGPLSAKIGPQRSFAQAFAKDDRARLLFVIDELSRVLRKERARGDTLQQRVVPMLVRHVEALERDAAQQRREIAALRRELALQFDLSRIVETASDESDGEGQSCAKRENMEERVKSIVERCEKQLRLLEAQEPVK